MQKVQTGPDRDLSPTRWQTSLHRRWLPAILALVLFALSLRWNLAAVHDSAFHPDESRWLNRAHYLADILEPTGPTWRDQYLIRGQPPVGSYIVGLGLVLQGRDLETNEAWVFERGDHRNVVWNVVKGAMPSQDDLEAGRRTSAVIGALTVVTLFLLVTRLSNWVGGVIGALFFAIHPLQTYLAGLAVADAAFTFIVALTTLSFAALASKPTWPRAILTGVLLGIGAGTKLSPLFLAIPFAGLGLALLSDNLLRRLPLVGRLWSLLHPTPTHADRRLGWLLLTLPIVATTFFVVSYPYLWPAPLERTRYLFKFRQDEMANQARIFPWAAIDSRFEALERMWTMLTEHYSATGRIVARIGEAIGRDWSGFGIDIPIAVAGLALLMFAVLRRGMTSSHGLTAAALAGQCALILGVLRVDFDRYYLPIVFTFAVGIGYLISQIAIGVETLVARRTVRSQPRPAASVLPTRSLPQPIERRS